MLHAVAPDTCVHNVHCGSRVKVGRAVTRLLARKWVRGGKRQLPVGPGRPTGEELGSVDPLGGSEEQGLSPKGFVEGATERGYKPGLLVATAMVKGFEKPWSILIDSGA